MNKEISTTGDPANTRATSESGLFVLAKILFFFLTLPAAIAMLIKWALLS